MAMMTLKQSPQPMAMMAEMGGGGGADDEHDVLLPSSSQQQQQQQDYNYYHQGAGAGGGSPPPPTADWPPSIAWIVCVVFAVLLLGLFVLEVDPARIDPVCGTGLWPLLLARVVCVVVMTGLQWLERSTATPPLRYANALGVAYHLAFTIALCVVLQASNVLTCPLCHNALEAAAAVTHSSALIIVLWLFLAWDALLTLLLLYYALGIVGVPPTTTSSTTTTPSYSF
jgi:hypothetical protein